MPTDSSSTSPTIPGAQLRSSNGSNEDFAALPPPATVNPHLVKTLPRPHGRPYSAEGAKEVGQERRNKSLSLLDVDSWSMALSVVKINGDTPSRKG